MNRRRNILLGVLAVVLVVDCRRIYPAVEDEEEEAALPTVGALTLGPEDSSGRETHWVDDRMTVHHHVERPTRPV